MELSAQVIHPEEPSIFSIGVRHLWRMTTFAQLCTPN